MICESRCFHNFIANPEHCIKGINLFYRFQFLKSTHQACMSNTLTNKLRILTLFLWSRIVQSFVYLVDFKLSTIVLVHTLKTPTSYGPLILMLPGRTLFNFFANEMDFGRPTIQLEMRKKRHQPCTFRVKPPLNLSMYNAYGVGFANCSTQATSHTSM